MTARRVLDFLRSTHVGSTGGGKLEQRGGSEEVEEAEIGDGEE